MKVFVALALFIGAVSAVPMNGQISPALRAMMLDMMKNMLKNMMPNNNNGPGAPPQRPPPIQFPLPSLPPNNLPSAPGPAFVPNMPPPMPPGRSPPQGGPNANGILMEMPANHYGGHPGYGGYIAREFCPPNMGPAGYNDACKEQILRDALYFSNGKPRYKWVTPLNPYDPSIPDNLKDYARHVLYKKVGGRAPTPEEARLMSILGDHPGHHFGSRVG